LFPKFNICRSVTQKPESISSLPARVLNLVDCGVIVLDHEGCIVLWNGWLVPRSGRGVARMQGHALIEVFRRRQHRSPEDLAPKLRNRIIAAYEASGLSRDDYAARVQGRDEATNALVAEALAEADARSARDEALLRAFEASGQTTEAGFADMYGMNPRQVAQQLERARRRLQTQAA